MTEKDLDIAIEKCKRIMEFDTRTLKNPESENGYIFEKVYDLLEFLRQFQFDTDTNVGGDPIDRQVAIDTVRKAQDKSEAHRMLVQLPSAQSERPKGEWLYGEHDIAMCDGYRCDQCGFFVPWDYKYKFIDFIKDYHWCPSCGADMRGEHGTVD